MTLKTGKYSLILFMLTLNLYMIVVMFSSYFVRREIEQELARPGLDTTIEEMRFNLEVALTGYRRVAELRCLQRDAITLYRLASLGQREAIGRIFDDLRPMRDALRDWAAKQGGLDIEGTRQAIDATWGLVVGTELHFAAGTSSNAREAIRQEFMWHARREVEKVFTPGFQDRLRSVLPREHRDAAANAGAFLAHVNAREANTLFGIDASIFEKLNVAEMERAIARIREQLKGFRLDGEDRRRGILLRLLVAERGITGATPGSSLLDRVQDVFDLARTDESRFGALDCEPPTRAAIDGLAPALNHAIDRSTWDANRRAELRHVVDELSRAVASESPELRPSFGSSIPNPHAWMSGRFIGLPTAAQTLIVCMLFGSLGALCFQGLRLSNFGYWASVADPTWGEVFTSVLLGTAAAMVIYLLAAVGMLVVSDGRGASGATNVGAGLVALLGFISGLLNDSAFARIRRFGQQIFSGDGARSDLQLSGADIELQKVLKDAGALRFAELARIHEIGRDLAKRGRFTLFVPDDAAFDALPHARWRELADPGNATPFLDLVLHRLVTAHRYDLKTIGGYQGIGIRNSVASTDTTKTSMTFGFPAGSPAAAPETVDGWSIDAKRRDISLFADDVGVLHVIGLPPGATPTRPL